MNKFNVEMVGSRKLNISKGDEVLVIYRNFYLADLLEYTNNEAKTLLDVRRKALELKMIAFLYSNEKNTIQKRKKY